MLTPTSNPRSVRYPQLPLVPQQDAAVSMAVELSASAQGDASLHAEQASAYSIDRADFGLAFHLYRAFLAQKGAKHSDTVYYESQCRALASLLISAGFFAAPGNGSATGLEAPSVPETHAAVSPLALLLGRPVRRFSALDAFRLQQALPGVDLVSPRGPGRPRKQVTTHRGAV